MFFRPQRGKDAILSISLRIVQLEAYDGSELSADDLGGRNKPKQSILIQWNSFAFSFLLSLI